MKTFIIGLLVITNCLTLLKIHDSKTATNDNYQIRSEKIQSYNAGYRAGKMDILAQLVECNGVKNTDVISYYNSVSNLLVNYGELDNAPYPCKSGD